MYINPIILHAFRDKFRFIRKVFGQKKHAQYLPFADLSSTSGFEKCPKQNWFIGKC